MNRRSILKGLLGSFGGIAAARVAAKQYEAPRAAKPVSTPEPTTEHIRPCMTMPSGFMGTVMFSGKAPQRYGKVHFTEEA